jgi:hypothetical protein
VRTFHYIVLLVCWVVLAVVVDVVALPLPTCCSGRCSSTFSSSGAGGAGISVCIRLTSSASVYHS